MAAEGGWRRGAARMHLRPKPNQGAEEGVAGGEGAATDWGMQVVRGEGEGAATGRWSFPGGPCPRITLIPRGGAGDARVARALAAPWACGERALHFSGEGSAGLRSPPSRTSTEAICGRRERVGACGVRQHRQSVCQTHHVYVYAGGASLRASGRFLKGCAALVWVSWMPFAPAGWVPGFAYPSQCLRGRKPGRMPPPSSRRSLDTLSPPGCTHPHVQAGWQGRDGEDAAVGIFTRLSRVNLGNSAGGGWDVDAGLCIATCGSPPHAGSSPVGQNKSKPWRSSEGLSPCDGHSVRLEQELTR
jgi:hypothetical protein